MFPGENRPPFTIELSDDGSGTLSVRKDGDVAMPKVLLEKGEDTSGASFTASIIDKGGEQFVRVDSTAVESGRLNYVVANDDGIGHGMVRLSIEPEFREITEPVGRSAEVTEDGLLSLAGQFELTGNYTSGVTEKVMFRLDSSMPEGFKLITSAGPITLTKNAAGNYDPEEISKGEDEPAVLTDLPSLQMPENYHGEIIYSFGLGSRADTTGGATKIFTANSVTDSITTSVKAAAEAPADQAVLGIFVGDDTEVSADLDGAIIPVVSGDPNANQTTRILLTGGDPNETHSVTLSNIPDGMTVTVGGEVVTVTFGTFTIRDVPIETEVPIQFTASPELLGSQFGLTDPTDQIRAVVTGEERGPDGQTVLASGQGQEVKFQFDIGASFGLNVSARALTVSDEDVAALLGSLDASVGDGAKLFTTITLDSQDVTLGRMTKTGDTYDPETFTAIDPGKGYEVTVNYIDLAAGDTWTQAHIDSLIDARVAAIAEDAGVISAKAAALNAGNADLSADDEVIEAEIEAGATFDSAYVDYETLTEGDEVVADIRVDLVHTVAVDRTPNNEDGTLTFALEADSNYIAAEYLEGIAVLPTTDHFKGTVTANVVFDATREITSDGVTSVIPLASAEKGPLTVSFDPVPDGVHAYDAPDEDLTTTEDDSISLASLFVDSGTPIASYQDTDETLYYEVSDVPASARLVDGSSFAAVKTEAGNSFDSVYVDYETLTDGDEVTADISVGSVSLVAGAAWTQVDIDNLESARSEYVADALRTAIADAPLIGRVVGDAIQLTVGQAQDAHLVVSADAHLGLREITLTAFTREPSTGDRSTGEDVKTDTVNVEVIAVADKPYLSYDPDIQTRGLVDVTNADNSSYLEELGLADKAQVSIPATVSLEDLDGSESLWVWIIPYSYEFDDEGNVVGISDNAASAERDFEFISSSGLTYTPRDGGDALVVKGSDLDEVLVSRGADYGVINGFDGIFRLEAVSLEGALTTADAAIAARSDGLEGADYAVQSAELKVEFLQPATKPTLTLSTDTVIYGDAIQIDLTVDQNPTDIVTVLATGVPTGSAFKDADGNAIGARAEVDGVWVFRSSDFGGTVTLKLPRDTTARRRRTSLPTRSTPWVSRLRPRIPKYLMPISPPDQS